MVSQAVLTVVSSISIDQVPSAPVSRQAAHEVLGKTCLGTVSAFERGPAADEATYSPDRPTAGALKESSGIPNAVRPSKRKRTPNVSACRSRAGPLLQLQSRWT